ncbi:tyrosine-type recombinase/integrase [Nannocystis pusilla]|uniref:tyrosine-type recombinase/integrase n=1 Tax=Nannocystis pusilla TaxID=889268 RepID=UPI003B7C75BC
MWYPLAPTRRSPAGLPPARRLRVRAGRRVQPHSFPRERREYVLEGTLGMRVRRAQGLARLAVYGPHRIRHSVLTLLARMGVSPYALQALARHARMATTMKYYIHLNQGELAAQAVAALADPDAFGNAKATRGNTPEFTLLT